MPEPRHNPHVPSPIRPNLGVPDTQVRALDRRQALDAQQRAFRADGGPSRRVRPRPPG